MLQQTYAVILKTYLEEQQLSSNGTASSTEEKDVPNLFTSMVEFFEFISLDAATEAFKKSDTDSADDDSDSIDIIISDITSHQSQQVQPLKMVTFTPSHTPSRHKHKKEAKLKQKAETADYFINKASPDQKSFSYKVV
ncbi:unnamed protein product [Rhizophagus irregularis]|uniref:Uncharacterized protein n=1 Tax=Rhizophagus irregularis TaxID=588596 RepID=A0A2I1H2X1_9GLOM|nr:hypothetical protein RhiirA4_471336 [Rhizophagus irregularis]CAB4424019.1 unnamed protein product [Rhizophagus irregularis]